MGKKSCSWNGNQFARNHQATRHYYTRTIHIASQAHKVPSLRRITSQQMTARHMRAHRITWHRVASRDMTPRKKSHHIKWHDMTPHHTTWHDMTSLSHPHHSMYHTSPCITSPPPTHRGNTTSHHQNATTKRNGRRLLRTKTSVWASHWLVIVFSLLKLPPPACPGTTCIHSFSSICGKYAARTHLMHQKD